VTEPDPHDELAPYADLPPDDPRIAALPPRLRARLHAYREFLAPGDVPDGARPDEAERRLGEMLERELGIAPAGRARAAAAAGAGGPRPLPWWTKPGGRLALAFAALVVVVAGSWLATLQTLRPREPMMRGAPDASRGGNLSVRIRALADGAVRLEWDTPPGADRFTLVFLSPDLTEIARVPDLQESHFDLRPGALPAGLAPGTRVLWRALALHGPDEIARSRTEAIAVP